MVDNISSMPIFSTTHRIPKINFHCKMTTEFGEDVRIVGSIDELGNWDPSHAIKLITTSQLYPIWKTESRIKLSKPPPTIEYKYLIFKGQSFIRWENLPNDVNRRLDVRNGKFLIENEGHSLLPHYIIIIREPWNKNSQGPPKRKYSEVKSEDELHKIFKSSKGSSSEKSEPTMTSSDSGIDWTGSSIELAPSDSVIIACLQLPFTIQKVNGEWEVGKSQRVLYPTLYDLSQKILKKVIWVGWPTLYEEDEDEKDKLEELLMREHNCYPVFFDKKTMKDYFKFYEDVLFPLFHNFVSPDDGIDFNDEDLWITYNRVNSAFANTITKLASESSLVWVHDIHLLTLPNHLYKKYSKCSVGLFIHSPFPSSVIYKMFPYRQEFLHCMLLCKVIGFHLFEYARNFLSACRRVLGIQHQVVKGGYLKLNFLGRDIIISVGHVGIEIDYLQETLSTEEFKNEQQKLSALVHDRVVIGSVDRFSPMAGILQKLEAFELFLEEREKGESGKYVLVQYCPLLHDRSYESLQQAIKDKVTQINKVYPDAVILYFGRCCLPCRLALCSRMDILFISILKQGFCLLPFEFMAVKDCMNVGPCSIVLSEFGGCTKATLLPIRTNPYHKFEMVRALEKATFMKKQIRVELAKNDMDYIRQHSTYRWAKSFLSDLKTVQRRDDKHKFQALGMGFNTRLMLIHGKFQILPTHEVVWAYRNSKKRLIILDTEGTIMPANPHKGHSHKQPHEAPELKVQEALRKLTEDKRNIVFVISGQEKDIMHKWFAHIGQLGIAAENGFFYRWNSIDKEVDNWMLQAKNVNVNPWMEVTLDIMKDYEEQTDGAYTYKKENSVLWSYRDADQDLAPPNAMELSTALTNLVGNAGVDIIHEKSYVEVRPKGLGKGGFVEKIIRTFEIPNQTSEPLDFVLCIGDEKRDEEMFKAINNKEFLKGAWIFCSTVGLKSSSSDYFLNDPDQVITLIEALATNI